MRIFCFEIEYIGWGMSQWKQFAMKGEKISAIRAYREAKKDKHGNAMGLREAKEYVEDWGEKHGVIW
jgi:hypothetical protein